jgi:metal-responsive CopG/Arc/MetJ family transcriptional regulator
MPPGVRAAEQTQVSISLPKELLAQLDTRAAKLGLSRSAYLVQLARADVADRGPMVLKEIETPSKTKNHNK